MLLCETGGSDAHAIEDLAVFVDQLNAAGVDARIDVRSVPAGLTRNAQFDLAPYLFDGRLGTGDRMVLVGAGRLTDQKLVGLRRLAGPSGTRCLLIGAFPDAQSLIGARAKLSYVFGRDPEVFSLDDLPTIGGEPPGDCPVFGVRRGAGPEGAPRLLLVAPDLQEVAQARALVSLALSRKLQVAVLTDGRQKDGWIAAQGTDIPIYHYGETLPASLAARVDLCVVCARLPSNYRVRCLLANLAVSGAALIDGTGGHVLSRGGDAFIPGPIDIVGLAPFLLAEILPNLRQISTEVRGSRTAGSCTGDALLRFLGARRRAPRAVRPARGAVRAIFMPTNGIGLGHAQRCALVAEQLDPARVAAVFAAFPSCVPLVKACGFDAMPLIGRSSLHAQTHENDLPNYLRLRALSATAAALVFDGVYVFDSVYRSILENRLQGVWLRRGLWQVGQDNRVALDREKAFARVVVPSEAFDELNGTYSRGDQVRVVGPIVRRVELGSEARAALRQRLAARFDRPFDRLVVSLLGAGVAADRSAQIQAICGMMARRSDVLHLVVVWPTAVLQPAWFAWGNSRIVRTHRAAALVAAADLCVSAAGYNSFHEILYTGVPAVFVPQMQSFMDDQRARARAASERGLAALVEAGQLMALDREVGRLLDDGEGEAVRRRFAALDLPATGNAQAAAVIEEVANGSSTLDRGARPGQRARRG